MYRSLLSILFAMLVVLPGIGRAGGDNAGGTGVWILPRASTLSPAMVSVATDPHAPISIEPREVRLLDNLQNNLALVASDDMGTPVATLVDGVSGAPIALPVEGRTATLTATMLQQLVGSGVTTATIILLDAQHRGYLVRLNLDLTTHTGDLTVF